MDEAPALQVTGACVIDPRADGIYRATQYDLLADGYLGAYWAPNSGGRAAWQRVCEPTQPNASHADALNTTGSTTCTSDVRCEFAIVFKNPDNTHANQPHWALYRHIDGEGVCLLEGPALGAATVPPRVGWRKPGETLPDGTCADLSGDLLDDVVIDYISADCNGQ